MLKLRHAFATAAAVMLVPAGHAHASIDGTQSVRDLATDAAQLLAEEVELLDMADIQNDAASTELAAVRAQLRTVDGQGQAALVELKGLGVEISPAIEIALALIPEGDVSPGAVSLAPQSIVYESAIDDLVRIAGSPEAVSSAASGSDSPSYTLLFVAALALVVLGAAALINSLSRRPEADELAAMAWSDGLTGLANRRRLDHDLTNENLIESPTSVIMIDLDHFKDVNDQFGHKVGDEVLCEFSQLLVGNVRSDDVVYRYGGEEFFVLLPRTGRDIASVVADRIVAAARGVRLPDGGHITVSVGIARSDGHDIANAVESADQALYLAKHEGRDRAVVAADAELVKA